MTDFYHHFAMSKFAHTNDRDNAIAKDWERIKAENAALKEQVFVGVEHALGNNMIVVKQRNLAAMMAIIRLRKISTNDLVAKTKLSRSTISNLSDELIKDGMIVCDQSKRPWRFSATAKGKK